MSCPKLRYKLGQNGHVCRGSQTKRTYRGNQDIKRKSSLFGMNRVTLSQGKRGVRTNRTIRTIRTWAESQWFRGVSCVTLSRFTHELGHNGHKGYTRHIYTYGTYGIYWGIRNILGQEGQNGHIGQGWGDSRLIAKPINRYISLSISRYVDK